MHTTNAAPIWRPQTDRFLLGIGVGIVMLLLAAGVSVAVLRQPAPALPANTPGGTVQRFYQALEQGDYDGAYAYLSDSMAKKPTRAEFMRNVAQRASYGAAQQRLQLASEKISGTTAAVTVQVTHISTAGPFGGADEYSITEVFTLQAEAGTWRITGMPYDYAPLP